MNVLNCTRVMADWMVKLFGILGQVCNVRATDLDKLIMFPTWSHSPLGTCKFALHHNSFHCKKPSIGQQIPWLFWQNLASKTKWLILSLQSCHEFVVGRTVIMQAPRGFGFLNPSHIFYVLSCITISWIIFFYTSPCNKSFI